MTGMKLFSSMVDTNVGGRYLRKPTCGVGFGL
jgi:hypothetical protein